ncbi:unnamed protein product [Rotaria sp. Silwood1]|nr:unnamed protein product [Rotaria sp. Silwood1]
MSTFEEIYGTKTSIDVKDMLEKCKNPRKKVLVLGRAGIGKSTFCRYVAYRWATGEIWPQYDLVVVIPLRSLTKDHYPCGTTYAPIDLVKNEYFSYPLLSNKDEELLKELILRRKVLWLLDGYDEIAENLPSHLQGFMEHLLDTTHHILTSRPHAIALQYDVKMEVTGFTDDNIVKYIQQFFDQIKDELN